MVKQFLFSTLFVKYFLDSDRYNKKQHSELCPRQQQQNNRNIMNNEQ